MLNKKKNNKGFTLVELLVVIAIIGILAVVAVPALFKNINKAKVADLQADYSAIKSAVLGYYTDENTFPSTVNGDLDEYMDTIPTKSALGEGVYTMKQLDLDGDVNIKENSLFLLVGDRELECKDTSTDHKHNDDCYKSGNGVTLTTSQSSKILSDMGPNMVYINSGNTTEYTPLLETTEGENIKLAMKLVDNTGTHQ